MKCKNSKCLREVGKNSNGYCRACQMKVWRDKLKRELITSMGGKCSICGYSKCIRALAFHHKDPTNKESTIARLFKGRQHAFKEIEKCILVCANCHMELHATQEEIILGS